MGAYINAIKKKLPLEEVKILLMIGADVDGKIMNFHNNALLLAYRTLLIKYLRTQQQEAVLI